MALGISMSSLILVKLPDANTNSNINIRLVYNEISLATTDMSVFAVGMTQHSKNLPTITARP